MDAHVLIGAETLRAVARDVLQALANLEAEWDEPDAVVAREAAELRALASESVRLASILAEIPRHGILCGEHQAVVRTEVGMNGHKDEALKALRTVIEALAGPEPIEGLRRHQLRATIEYVQEQVEAIAELKRARRAKEPE